MKMSIYGIAMCFCTILCNAQGPAPTQAKPQLTGRTSNGPDESPQDRTVHKEPGYTLGSGDQLIVRVPNFDEITDKPVPVELDGTISLPVVGRVPAAGLTTTQLEARLREQLGKYLLHPDVSVSVTDFHSQPVSVIGAVKTPGVVQVQGRKTVVEALSMAGGLDTTAGPVVKLTRKLDHGRIPLPNAKDDPTGQYSVAEINTQKLFNAKDPQDNIFVEPDDVISVPRADTVYVIGQVQKAGGFPLNDHEDMSVLQAVSMAGGMTNVAQPKNAKLLRKVPGAEQRTEIAVNLNNILNGKTSDVPMQPEDILFIPDNKPKKAGTRIGEAAIQMVTGMVVWGRVP